MPAHNLTATRFSTAGTDINPAGSGPGSKPGPGQSLQNSANQGHCHHFTHPCPRINLTEFDIYGILDADTPEAHAFTTYLAYWDCLERSILEIYGEDPHPALLSELQSRKAFNKLKNRPFRGDKELLRSLLLNGWNSEQNLYLVDVTHLNRSSASWLRGMKADDAKRLKELEGENARLKKLSGEAELDKSMLKEIAERNF